MTRIEGHNMFRVFVSLAVGLLALSAKADELTFKGRALEQLVAHVPGILKSYDSKNGRFGEGLFVVADQNQIFPLAVAYATQSPKNPYFKDSKLLEVLMRGGDVLIEVQDAQGRWRFDKKDGSYWGQIYMPWTYSRWIRAYALMKDDMPAKERDRWESALRKGFAGISASGLQAIHNIPTHYAMGLYIAGGSLGKPDWQKQAADFMQRVVATQKEGGYWSEHAGPVVQYDYVYMDAIGIYYAISGDERVLPALARAAVFHRNFTYPDGSDIETVDERNPYHGGIGEGVSNVGFTMTPEGRAYLAEQWNRTGGALSADAAASFILYGQEGPATPRAENELFVLAEQNEPRAMTLAKSPWFVAISGYTAEPTDNRWIQDRQNLISVWRKGPGLIVGGGNTKLQPEWSTFTIGDVNLLRHSPGDENPTFKAQGELYHVPSSAILVPGNEPTLTLRYGAVTATVQVHPVDDSRLEIDYAVMGDTTLAAAAHVTLLPEMGAVLKTDGGHNGKLSDQPISLDSAKLGTWLEFRGIRYHVPVGTALHWPSLPHNPYRKDGSAKPAEGRIELRVPLQLNGPPVTLGIDASPKIHS